MTTSNFYTNVHLHKNELLVRGIHIGRAFQKAVPYKPTLFISASDDALNPEWHSILSVPLQPMPQNSIYDAKEFIDRYKEIAGFTICGFPRFAYAYINEVYPGPIDYQTDKIRTVIIDIEVDSSNGFPTVEATTEEILSIAIKDRAGYRVFGLKPFINNDPQNVTYVLCSSEAYLLSQFLAYWKEGGHPDIISGWSVATFDIPYLYRRIAMILGSSMAKTLSPWDLISERKGYDKFGQEITYVDIIGIETLDYLDLYRKYTYSQQASYKLDHIAHVELGDKKLSYNEYANLMDLYHRDHQKFIEYNIQDVRLIERLDEKMKLLDLVLLIAYDAKVNYTDVSMQVRLWDVLIHNYLYAKKIAVPVDGSGTHKEEAYAGAYVKEPQLGRHHWVMNYDVDSMYPNLIRMFNISPETLLTECHAELTVEKLLTGYRPTLNSRTSFAPNGCLFLTDQVGFLSEMMKSMLARRNEYKAAMLSAKRQLTLTTTAKEKAALTATISKFKNLQLAIKVQANSLYGSMGNEHGRYFDLRLATAITLGGQLVIRYAEQEINGVMNRLLNTINVDYVIASDTDSLYLKMDAVVARLLSSNPSLTTDQIVTKLNQLSETKLVPAFNTAFDVLARSLNAQTGTIIMKREAIADQGIWTAKKRYILNVYDNEGVRYSVPELKVMGIESVKSSTPASCRVAIDTAMKLLVRATEPDLQTYIIQYREEFFTLPFEDIAFPRSVKNLSKYQFAEKGVPIHVAGSLLYNRKLRELELTKKYETIKEGEKIKYAALIEPNPFDSHVIAAPGFLPHEFEIAPYLDYHTQFEKAFLQPLTAILAAVGWKSEPRGSLDSFFS